MAKKNMTKPKNRVDNYDNLPTSPVTPIRLCAFQATRRPAKVDELEIITPFGEVTVTGRIGQSHADFLDCVMHHKDGRIIINDRLMVRFDPHELRMAMGGGESKYSAEQMKVIEKDLLSAILGIKTPKFKFRGHIIESILEATKAVPDRRSWAKEGNGQRPLMVVTFSPEWTQLFLHDIGSYYDPKPLCRLDRGGVAAIARHVLTHQHEPSGGWKLERLIKAAGVTRRPDKVKQEMLDSAGLLAELGIILDGDRVKMSTDAPFMSTDAPFMSTPAPFVSTPAPF